MTDKTLSALREVVAKLTLTPDLPRPAWAALCHVHSALSYPHHEPTALEHVALALDIIAVEAARAP